MAPLATIKDESLSSVSSISPLSEQALQSPSYIDVGVCNFSSLDMDRDIKFALLDNPNKPPLQVWPYKLVTKQGKQEKRTLGPQHLERYQFLTYSMIQEGLYCRFCLEKIKKAGGGGAQQRFTMPVIFTLLQIGATLPVTVCTAERSFSSMKLLKSYLRSNMKEDRLSNLALIYIYKDEEINVEEVIGGFAAKNRRLNFV